MRPPASSRSALVVVDVQRDFCPGGALSAEGGSQIVPAINRYLAEAHRAGWTVYATRDWHPEVTAHFEAYGGQWPVHCVQGTSGAEFHPDLTLPAGAVIVSKGDDPSRPGYSAFEGRTPDGTAFGEDLNRRGIDSLSVAGIATDYCVKQTVMDAREAGLRVTVLTDGVTGIDASPGDVARAVSEMEAAGAAFGTGLPQR